MTNFTVAGAFTAPVSGYYFFTFSTYDYNNYPSGAYMLKNGVIQISTYEHTSTDTSDSSSNSAVLQLAAGDKIHIELWEGSRVIDSSNHHTTFSGFLLYEIKQKQRTLTLSLHLSWYFKNHNIKHLNLKTSLLNKTFSFLAIFSVQ